MFDDFLLRPYELILRPSGASYAYILMEELP
jgi:hypothetical protein